MKYSWEFKLECVNKYKNGVYIATPGKEDYRIMQPIIYGERPPFEEILKSIQYLENEINSLA